MPARRWLAPVAFRRHGLAIGTPPGPVAAGNLLIGGVPARAERAWPGHALVIGEAVIGIRSLRGRCIVTSVDPDTGAQDLDVFRRIRHRFGGRLGLDSWVIEPGTIRVGDPVTLEHTHVQPDHIGGWIVGAPYTR